MGSGELNIGQRVIKQTSVVAHNSEQVISVPGHLINCSEVSHAMRALWRCRRISNGM